MKFPLFLEYLGEKKLGFFGVGHLGKAILRKLLKSGFPREKIIAMHKGSEETKIFLERERIPVLSKEDFLKQAKCIFYLVRPQEIEKKALSLPPDSLVVSFLAGVEREKIEQLFKTKAMRLAVASPDAIIKGMSISAIAPEPDQKFQEILHALQLKPITLSTKQDWFYFVIASCLPNVYVYLNGEIAKEEIISFLKETTFDSSPIIAWAKQTYRKDLSTAEKEDYLRKAATKGGITEAIFQALGKGNTITEALKAGLKKSKELAN
ncbi:NAD(P)-binding domain-containing protein [Candidatus Woesearchaeota archaeon]|nr:NAD(P)-binding domain-containing protein [Candidatus Woesearchaeota archaeon]